MKKTELINCPQWLLDADTENEDVDFDSYGILIWRGGNFRGGNFRGGNFLGGNFWGGNFWGGNFLAGDFRGGDFRGGNFRGGDFRGGDFRGGDFLGGNFLGGNFRGDKITRKPISIYGLEWPIIITEIKMQIGCQVHANDAWANFTDKEISRMHAKAADFWNTNKTFLLAICKNEMDAAALTKSKGEQK